VKKTLLLKEWRTLDLDLRSMAARLEILVFVMKMEQYTRLLLIRALFSIPISKPRGPLFSRRKLLPSPKTPPASATNAYLFFSYRKCLRCLVSSLSWRRTNKPQATLPPATIGSASNFSYSATRVSLLLLYGTLATRYGIRCFIVTLLGVDKKITWHNGTPSLVLREDPILRVEPRCKPCFPRCSRCINITSILRRIVPALQRRTAMDKACEGKVGSCHDCI
jgi:hypothetical protein